MSTPIVAINAQAPIVSYITGGDTANLYFQASGVTIGSYSSANIVVDAFGRITAATNGTGSGGTVTSITAGVGLTGGTITTSGTIALDIPVSLAHGGTSAALTASNGGIFYSTSSAAAILSGTSTANQIVLSGATAAPTWSTATYPPTTTINQLLYSSAANAITGLATANNGVLITSAGGAPSIGSTLPAAVQGNITAVGTIASGTWSGSLITGTYGGTGVNNGASTITIGGNHTLSGAFTSTFTFTGNTSVTFPTSGTLSTTTGTVTSVSGTTNRITSTGGATPVIDISASYVGQSSITTLGTIATGVWNGSVIGGTYGGTGVNNGASTFTIGGNVAFSGAHTFTGTVTANTSVTFPTSGTLSTTTGTVTSVTGTANQIDVATGTTTPVLSLDSTLQVPGTLRIQNTSTTAFAVNSGTPAAIFAIDTSTPKITLGGNVPLVFGPFSSSYTYMQMGGGNSSGYIWSYFPTVGDGINIGYNYYIDPAGTAHIPNAGGATSSLQYTYGAFQFNVGAVNTAPTAVVQIDSNGIYPAKDNAVSCGKTGNRWTAVWAVNGTIQTSDGTQKKNIYPSILGLDFINKLQPKSWNWCEGPDTDKCHHGFVYDDVVSIAPTSFGGIYPAEQHKSSHQDLGADKPTETVIDGVNGLNYTSFIAPLVKAIQELSAKVVALEAKLGVAA